MPALAKGAQNPGKKSGQPRVGSLLARNRPHQEDLRQRAFTANDACHALLKYVRLSVFVGCMQ
jgi:hypothetical protein